MIFQHTWQKVLNGEKTQTRRLVHPRDRWYQNSWDPDTVVRLDAQKRERTLYEVGKTYAVQPGRGQSAVDRIRLTAIGQEDVREISLEDAKAEGFTNQLEFWYTWVQMHDQKGYGLYFKGSLPVEILKHLFTRPNDRYQAWVLTFEVVQA